ncbi:hypothetical protein DID78_06555 [Candidatus Marinamargulisbacteria bacterium SCGC AG-343-D04]|nr:hypothetical protein DID78_06555 [Candidatus Marinamargulisbacteria bacterium SCGC AG-343-D04]
MYSHDSRTLRKGDTFLCLPGGEAFCDEALKRGAANIITCSRQEMADIANRAYDFPSKKLNVIGVTGTNGKTSVCSFVGQALQVLGRKPLVQGTLNSPLTTPESLDTLTTIHAHVQEGGTDFIMEVSSHGIDQGRIEGIDFTIKCLTNISQDHLDYHPSFEHYRDTKERFMNDYPGTSLRPSGYLSYDDMLNKNLKGSFNQHNLKAALAILIESGFSLDESVRALQEVKAPPGRFEAISSTAPFEVVVDYAHTPDALENTLKEAKEMALKQNAQLITCFGCGGDRDKSKRPLMAKAAAKYSDVIIVTQDNPRTENPTHIVNDIIEGFCHEDDYSIQEDRKKAIELALQSAQKHDVVVIAGKGHEAYQMIGKESLPFDDKEIALASLIQMGYA